MSATAQACGASQRTVFSGAARLLLHFCGVAFQQSNPLFSSCQHEPLMLADGVSVFWVEEVRGSLNLEQRDCFGSHVCSECRANVPSII